MHFSMDATVGGGPFMLVLLGIILHIITLISYIQRKNWSLIMSIVNLSFLNMATIYHAYLALVAGAGRIPADADLVIWLHVLIVFLSLIASIDNAKCHSNAKADENKIFWMKINQIPTERDNTLFKAGCAISSVIMGVALTMPFFSVNIRGLSASYSFLDLLGNEIMGTNISRSDILVPVQLALIMLIIHIVVLFFISFSKSKAVKTTIGITTAVSIATIVFVSQTLFFNAIEGFLSGNPLANRIGLPGLIANSIGNIFTSIFRLEIGVWVLLGSLAAYIIFASCQFSRIKKPAVPIGHFPIGQFPIPQATVIKVRCVECNSVNDESAAFCNSCGKPMAKEKPETISSPEDISSPKDISSPEDISSPATECAGCGAKLKSGMKFCNECGNAIF